MPLAKDIVLMMRGREGCTQCNGTGFEIFEKNKIPCTQCHNDEACLAYFLTIDGYIATDRAREELSNGKKSKKFFTNKSTRYL